MKTDTMPLKVREIYERNHLDTEILDLTLDSAFKKVFSDEKNKWLLAFLIDYCTNLGINYILKHLKYKNNFISSNNLSNKTGEGDLIVEVEDKIINLEMNKRVTETLIRKNKFYVTAQDSSYTKFINSQIIDNKFIIQINISNGPRIKGTNRLMYEITLMDKNLLIEDAYNNFIIYDINLAYLKSFLYNKEKIQKKEKRLLIFIEKNKDKLNNLFKGDENMQEAINNLDGIGYFKDNEFAFTYDHEALNEITQKEEIQEYQEELKMKDKEYQELLTKKDEELKQSKIDIARNLLQEKMPIEKIATITNLSIEDIENI